VSDVASGRSVRWRRICARHSRRAVVISQPPSFSGFGLWRRVRKDRLSSWGVDTLQCTRFTAVGYPCGPVRARLEARFSMDEVEPAEEKPRAEGPDPSPVPTPWNLGLAHDQSSWRGARTGRSSRGSRREVALRGQWRRSGPVADSRCGSRRGRVRRYRSLATRPLHRRRLRSPRHLPQPTRRPALRHHGAGAGRCRGADGTTVLDGRVADQSAFHGLLRKVIDLGLLLVSVTPTPGIQTSTAADLPHPVDDDL
jgi:hypothetical protein